jgi:NAD(P)-dependent dehydrogenase (short-subunit alcohol dehydrogenase family)
MKDLRGKTAFIAGGADGAGFAIARAFGGEGMNVMIADIDEPALHRAVEDLRGKNINARGVHTDVARRDSMRKAALETISAFGKVHVVCNSANVPPTNGLLGCLSEGDWDRIIDINIHAVVHAAEVFVPLIESHGEGGHIVNIGSAASFIVQPGGEADCGTHFAVVALTEGWNEQLGPRNIGVSIVCPVVGIAPESLGRRVVDGIKNDELYIFTQSGEFREMAEGRFEPIREAFRKSQLSPTLRDLPARILPFA